MIGTMVEGNTALAPESDISTVLEATILSLAPSERIELLNYIKEKGYV